jgi:hypothetical protein
MGKGFENKIRNSQHVIAEGVQNSIANSANTAVSGNRN